MKSKDIEGICYFVSKQGNGYMDSLVDNFDDNLSKYGKNVVIEYGLQ